MKSIIITALLAAAAMAAPEVKTTIKDATHTPPICRFDPVKGEYVCPETTNPWGVIGDHPHSLRRADVSSTSDFTTASTSADASADAIADAASASADDGADAPAADCGKCQADWEKCLTHWGCWFYNCGPACHCQVAKNDPSCSTCPGQECHA